MGPTKIWVTTDEVGGRFQSFLHVDTFVCSIGGPYSNREDAHNLVLALACAMGWSASARDEKVSIQRGA